MQHTIFISHNNCDQEIAEIVANSLQRITLHQIQPWFSSDISADGGLKPGNIWLNEILNKITQSKAVIVLLTPNSIDSHWVHFESGMAGVIKDFELIPVCVGVKRDSILPPLGMFQCFQLTDYISVKEFFGKLLVRFQIHFDEELSKPILERVISQLSNFSFQQSKETNSSYDDFSTHIQDLKSFLDKRFIDLMEYNSRHMVNTGAKKDNVETKESQIKYTTTINVNFPEFKGSQYIEIREEDSVSTILNTIYLLIKKYIQPYTYMEDWILRNPKNDMFLIIREVGSLIPAKLIFNNSIIWEVIKLKEPYSPVVSNNKYRLDYD